MPNINNTLDVILPVLSSKSSKYSYKGIERKFFPKWEGWRSIDDDMFVDELVVSTFYKEYFWDRLLCDDFKSQYVVNLLMAFAITSGKKKAVSKLNRIIGVSNKDYLDNTSINIINASNQDNIFLSLFADIVEFYVSINTPEKINPLVHIYYDYLNRELI